MDPLLTLRYQIQNDTNILQVTGFDSQGGGRQLHVHYNLTHRSARDGRQSMIFPRNSVRCTPIGLRRPTSPVQCPNRRILLREYTGTGRSRLLDCCGTIGPVRHTHTGRLSIVSLLSVKENIPVLYFVNCVHGSIIMAIDNLLLNNNRN